MTERDRLRALMRPYRAAMVRLTHDDRTGRVFGGRVDLGGLELGATREPEPTDRRPIGVQMRERDRRIAELEEEVARARLALADMAVQAAVGFAEALDLGIAMGRARCPATGTIPDGEPLTLTGDAFACNSTRVL